MKKTKDGHIHLSVHVAPEVARAAKIQSIKEEMSMQEWITKAIMRQLAESGAARQPQGAA